MGFETVVLEKVSEVVEENRAYFAYGSMFVTECTPAEASKIQTVLSGYGVIVTPGSEEFAFDFV